MSNWISPPSDGSGLNVRGPPARGFPEVGAEQTRTGDQLEDRELTRY
jgi:hypothetical protein